MSRAGLLAKLASVAPPHGYTSWPQASGARLLDITRPACERCEGNRGLVASLEEWGQGSKVELSEVQCRVCESSLILPSSSPGIEHAILYTVSSCPLSESPLIGL